MYQLDNYEKMVNELPKALTEEEQKLYMDIFYKSKDRKSPEAQKAREKLITGNLRLVPSIINRYFDFSQTPKDEMYSCGVEWMMKAIDNFDIDKGFALSTYLVTAIKNGIIREYTLTNRHLVKTDSLNAPVSNDLEEGVATYEDLEPDPDNFVENANRMMSNEYFMQRLPATLKQKYTEKQIEMLYRHVGIMGYEKQTLETIGELYGLTRERVRQIISREFGYIKTELLGIPKTHRKDRDEKDDRYH